MRRFAIAVAGLLAAATLGGCVQTSTPVPNSGPVAFMPSSGGTGAYMDALLEGTVRIEEQCVTVEAYGEVFVPVFEVGVATYSDGVLIYGSEFRNGDQIKIGGGTADSTTRGHPAEWYVPEGCTQATLWAASPPGF